MSIKWAPDAIVLRNPSWEYESEFTKSQNNHIDLHLWHNFAKHQNPFACNCNLIRTMTVKELQLNEILHKFCIYFLHLLSYKHFIKRGLIPLEIDRSTL